MKIRKSLSELISEKIFYLKNNKIDIISGKSPLYPSTNNESIFSIDVERTKCSLRESARKINAYLSMNTDNK